MKNSSKIWKVIGGFLLLLSFILQNFLFDKWDKINDQFMDSNREFSAMSRASLLYLNLYFNTKLDNPSNEADVKRTNIHMAAKKEAEGMMIEISERNDITAQRKADLKDSLFGKAGTVWDYYSYNNFIIYADQIDPYNPTAENKRIKDMDKKRDQYRFGFLVTYILGAISLLWGSYKE